MKGCFLTFCSTIEFNPYLPLNFEFFYHSSLFAFYTRYIRIYNPCLWKFTTDKPLTLRAHSLSMETSLTLGSGRMFVVYT